jgi:hypothetical protein
MEDIDMTKSKVKLKESNHYTQAIGEAIPATETKPGLTSSPADPPGLKRCPVKSPAMTRALEVLAKTLPATTPTGLTPVEAPAKIVAKTPKSARKKMKAKKRKRAKKTNCRPPITLKKPSRYGGSMPDAKIEYYEGEAQRYLHPTYKGLHHARRTYEFALAYGHALEATGLFRSGYTILRQCYSFAELLEAPATLRHLRKARIRADLHGALYEQYLEAQFDHYAKMKPNPVNGRPRFPWLRMLYSENCSRVYKAYYRDVLIKRGLTFKRDEANPDTLAENYTGTKDQIYYCTELLKNICAHAEMNRRSVLRVMAEAIDSGLMPRAFAEDPGLNKLTPRYFHAERTTSPAEYSLAK